LPALFCGARVATGAIASRVGFTLNDGFAGGVGTRAGEKLAFNA